MAITRLFPGGGAAPRTVEHPDEALDAVLAADPASGSADERERAAVRRARADADAAAGDAAAAGAPAGDERPDGADRSGPFAWIALGVDEGDELARIADRLGVQEHALSVIASTRGRPRIVRYPDHSLLVVSTVAVAADPAAEPPEPDRASARDAAGEIGAVDAAGAASASSLEGVTREHCTAIVLPRVFVTVSTPGFPMDAVRETAEAERTLARCGVPYLSWALLSTVVDAHIDVLEALDDASDALVDAVFQPRPHATALQRRAFSLRRAIASVRHSTLPMRELATSLERRSPSTIDPVLLPYFTDVYDHTVHAADWAETLSDTVSSIMETNVALQGNRMNDIMKKVTSWAAIIAVPTAITGFFGQNLSFPGYDTEWGAWMSLGAILLSGLVLYALFKRRDWL